MHNDHIYKQDGCGVPIQAVVAAPVLNMHLTPTNSQDLPMIVVPPVAADILPIAKKDGDDLVGGENVLPVIQSDIEDDASEADLIVAQSEPSDDTGAEADSDSE